MKKFALLTACIIVFLFVGCNSDKKEKIIPENSNTKSIEKKDCRVCMMEAAAFYAGGGDIFNDQGCKISTTNKGDRIYIYAYDEYNNYNRTAKLWIPITWFKEDRDKLSTIDEEYKAFMKCFEEKSDQDNARNPLLKEVPKDNGCNWISLTVNDVPGTRVECRKAPHFSFDALVKQ